MSGLNLLQNSCIEERAHCVFSLFFAVVFLPFPITNCINRYYSLRSDTFNFSFPTLPASLLLFTLSRYAPAAYSDRADIEEINKHVVKQRTSAVAGSKKNHKLTRKIEILIRNTCKRI